MSRMSEMAEKLAAKTTSGTKVAVLSLVKFLEEIGWKVQHGIVLVNLGERKYSDYPVGSDIEDSIKFGVRKAMESGGLFPSYDRRVGRYAGPAPPHEVRVIGTKPAEGIVLLASYRHHPHEEAEEILSHLPPVPGRGEKAVVRGVYVGDVENTREGVAAELYEAYEGWKVTAPDGATYDLPKGKAAHTGQFLRWAYKHGLAEDAAGFDPEAEAERVAESRTREGTGTCPVCFRNIKMKQKKGKRVPSMVLHGYKRPRWGHVVGNCPGTGWPPYELSDEGTREYARDVKGRIAATKEELEKVERAKTLTETKHDYVVGKRVKKTYRQGSYDFDRLKESRIYSLQLDIRNLENERDAMENAIAAWEERTPPLTEFQVNQILKGTSPKMRRGMA
jgi:hypothetical protein